jgi:hypothetical protein
MHSGRGVLRQKVGCLGFPVWKARSKKVKDHCPEGVPHHSPFSLGSKLLRLSQLVQWGRT